MSEEDACDICDGGQSSKKNPIIFCDGEGCNLPVHKICYKVDEIPEDDWYCQRCVAKKRKKNINIICCSKQTGALKQTIVSDSYMHVVCAMWNKTIKDDMEPYSFNKRQLDLQECYLCSKKKGICIECEEPSCTTRFHATCAINNGLITSARSIPSDYSPRCGQHQPKPKPKPKRQKRRVIRRKETITSSEEESEESDDEDDDDEEEEEQEDSEQEEEEEEVDVKEAAHESEESEDEMGKSSSGSSSSNKGKSIVPTPGTKRKEATSISKLKQPPEKKRSPHSLFANDQMSTEEDEEDEDEDEDDMGTRSSSVSSSSKLKRYIDKNKNDNNSSSNGIKQQQSKANIVNNIKSNTLTATTTTTTTTTTSTTTQQQQQQSYRERLEAKRKKNTNEKSNMRLNLESKTALPPPPPPLPSVSQQQQQISLSSSSSSSSSSPNINQASSSSTIAPVPVKQKLPNKAHLCTPSSSKSQNVQRPPSMTPPIKKPSGNPGHLDIDKITDSISSSQRWNNSGINTQPTTPHSSSVSFFENDNRMSSAPRRSIDEWRTSGGDRDELMRLRDEVHRLNEFKRLVADIFTSLKVVVPSTNTPSENIDLYVSELHALLRRVGPMRDEDDSRVRECVSKILKNKR